MGGEAGAEVGSFCLFALQHRKRCITVLGTSARHQSGLPEKPLSRRPVPGATMEKARQGSGAGNHVNLVNHVISPPALCSRPHKDATEVCPKKTACRSSCSAQLSMCRHQVVVRCSRACRPSVRPLLKAVWNCHEHGVIVRHAQQRRGDCRFCSNGGRRCYPAWCSKQPATLDSTGAYRFDAATDTASFAIHQG